MIVAIGPGITHLFRRNDILCPALITRDQLEQKRLESGPYVFGAQYLQDPVAVEGNLLNRADFRRFAEPIDRNMFEKVYQSWDTATSALVGSDWSVCLTWGYLAGRYFLLDSTGNVSKFPN